MLSLNNLCNMFEAYPPYEFCYSIWEDYVYKYLWNFSPDESGVIKDILKNNWYYDFEIKRIFDLHSSYIHHYWVDLKTNRVKIYLDLYNTDYNTSISIIDSIKSILWISKETSREKNFIKYDCLWIDICHNWQKKLKIYELIDVQGLQVTWLKIKEIWILKDLDYRRKTFIRLNNPYEKIDKVFKDLCFDHLSFHEKVNKNLIKKNLKYICIEWDKKEIYFN